MRAPLDETLGRPDPDPTWNMVLFLMRSHLHQENVLMSTLATTANVPFASAMRRIHRTIEDARLTCALVRPRRAVLTGAPASG